MAVDSQGPAEGGGVDGEALATVMAIGFPARVAAAALADAAGNVAAAVNALLTAQPASAASAPAAAVPAPAPPAAEDEATRRLRRVNGALDAMCAQCGGGAAALTCVRTMLVYVGNALEHWHDGAGADGGRNYRRIRLSNAAFQRRVAALGGVPVLEAVGWARSGDALEWRRDDPGLLWLAKSCLEQRRTQLDATPPATARACEREEKNEAEKC